MKESRNPNHRPTLKDFREAASRLEGISLHTPLLPLRRYREEDTGILLKPEMLQPIGSYKIRGVYNWVARLTPEQRARGIATLSAGNMSQAVGYIANLYSIPSRVAISDTAPQSKIDNCKKYGSEIELVKFNDETFNNADSLAHGYCFIHTLKEYGLMDGHGTIGLEILEDAPYVDTIDVPLGAGFLACGIALAAKALKSDVKVIGVNAEHSPHFYSALKAGKPAPYDFKPTLADGVAGGGALMPWESIELVKETLDDVVLISEKEIAKAVRFLALENKLVAEGAGAIGLAAAMATPKEKRGRSVCVLSGGSIDAVKLAHILEES
jgi:threonine dehydratase